MLSKEEASRGRWREVVEMKTETPIDEAFRHYHLNLTSFSEKLSSAASSAASGYREKRSLSPWCWAKSYCRLDFRDSKATRDRG